MPTSGSNSTIASDAAVDLTGWALTLAQRRRGQGNARARHWVRSPVGQTFLIANYAADHKNSLLAVEPQRVDSAVSLPNTKLLLHLYDGDPQAGGQLIDVADDGRGAPFAGDSASKSAMVRIAFDQSGDQPESWATATEQSGWDAGASELGTPGSIPAYLLPEGERSARARHGNERFTDVLGLGKRASVSDSADCRPKGTYFSG